MVQQLSIGNDGNYSYSTKSDEMQASVDPLEMSEYLEERGLGNSSYILKEYPTSPRIKIGNGDFLTLSLNWSLAGAMVPILLLISLIVTGLSCGFSSCPDCSKEVDKNAALLDEFGKFQADSRNLAIELQTEIILKNAEIERQRIKVQELEDQHSDIKNQVNSKTAEIELHEKKIREMEDNHNELKTRSQSYADKVDTLRKYFEKKNWVSELFLAVDVEDEEGVKLLIDFGADVNGKGSNSETALHRAATCNDTSFGVLMIKLLIENGADPFAKTDDDYTFLHKLVDEETKLTPSQFDDSSKYLISKNLSQIFNIPGDFIKGWRTPRYYFKYKSSTPLQLAVRNIDVKTGTLSLLYQNGVNFNATNSEGETALKYAVEGNQNVTLLSDLVNLGGDWKQVNGIKNNLLHTAALFGNLEGLKLLVDLGLDVNAVDDHGNTPLHYVALYGKRNSLKIVRFLIENGANVNQRNGGGGGETAFDRAKFRYDGVDKVAIIKLLKDSL